MGNLSSVQYLMPPPGYLWKWSEDSEAIEWMDGTTVVFRNELRGLLGYLAPAGLPPLGAIVLLLAACQDGWLKRWAHVLYCAETCRSDPGAAGHISQHLSVLKPALQAVHDLPADLRTGLAAKYHLVESVLERTGSRLSTSATMHVLEDFDLEFPGLRNLEGPADNTARRLQRDLKALASALAKLHMPALASRLQTGVDAELLAATLPLEKESEDPPSRGDLLSRLAGQEDELLGALGDLSRRVVAMFSVPRPVGSPQELPVGGVNDITNRGVPERLLVSELAWDDWMFAARLAQGEALYLLRECPPDAPRTSRLLLLDHGLHAWGLPRLYGLACTLGLRAQVPGEEDVWLRIRNRDTFAALVLDNVADVQRQLAWLALDPDPVPALETLAFPETAPGSRLDVYFICDSVTHARPEVQAQLRRMPQRLQPLGGRFSSITVDRSGAVGWLEWTSSGFRRLLEARLDLDEILRARKPAPGELAADAPATTPGEQLLFEELLKVAGFQGLEFYSRARLPLKYPARGRTGGSIHREGDVCVGVDDAGWLVRWESACGAGLPLSPRLPAASTYYVFAHTSSGSSEWHVVCIGKAPGDTPKLVRIDEKSGGITVTALPALHLFPSTVRIEAGALVFSYVTAAEALSIRDGRQIGLYNPGGSPQAFSSIRDRLCFDGERFHVSPERRPSHPSFSLTELTRWSVPERPGLPEAFFFLADGSPALLSVGRIWSFNPETCEVRLAPVRNPRIGADLDIRMAFRPLDEGDSPGHMIWCAGSSKRVEVFYDARGYLHLRAAKLPQVSILFVQLQRGAAWVAADGPGIWHGDPAWWIHSSPTVRGEAGQLADILAEYARRSAAAGREGA